ncbi:MAG: hypothetical protein RIS76_3349 [Verrucomicrobiota bacterium]
MGPKFVKLFMSSRWLPAVGIVLALLLLAGAVSFTRQSLRAEFRAQLARRDATLVATLLNQHLREARSKSPDDWLVAVLETAGLPELQGLLSLTTYDTNGRFADALTLLGSDANLTAGEMEDMENGEPLSRYGPASEVDPDSLAALPGQIDAPLAPVLEVLIPVPSVHGLPGGYTRFLFDGAGLSREYAALDATLRSQSLLAFLLAGAAMTVALAFVFHRLAETQSRLVSANRELTLAAKTAAVGAVTAHLIHGLKNPLAGLHQFVSAGAVSLPTDAAADWTEAAGTTRRMQSMIDSITGILREESGLVRYEISPRELLEQLLRRETLMAREAGVDLRSSVRAARPMLNREANIALLILENLVRNAVQATPSGGCVRISADETPLGIEFRVLDSGPGMSPEVLSRLFTPVVSTKEGGTGLGLALSQQLARSLGADLDLVNTGPGGTEFVLRLLRPVSLGLSDVASVPAAAAG